MSRLFRRFFRNLMLPGLACLALHAGAEPLVLVTAHYPPFSYEDGNQQKGLAIELVKEAFARMNQQIQIQLLPFPRAVAMLQSGEADGIFPFATSEDRKTFARFPAERLISDPGALFVRANSGITFDGNYANLAPYALGIQRGANYGPVFMQALKVYDIKTDEAIDQEQNVQKLIAGRFDIAVAPRLVFVNAAKRTGKASEIKLLYAGISDGDAYLGFSRKKNLDDVIARFEQTLKRMKQDGSYDRILRAY